MSETGEVRPDDNWKHVPIDDLITQIDEHFDNEGDILIHICTGDYTRDEIKQLNAFMKAHPLNNSIKFSNIWESKGLPAAIADLSSLIDKCESVHSA